MSMCVGVAEGEGKTVAVGVDFSVGEALISFFLLQPQKVKTRKTGKITKKIL